MPQAHNKSIALSMDSTAFNKSSRYMSTIRMTQASKRKIRAFNTVENRLKRIRINYYNRHADIERYKQQRERDKVMEAIKKRNAYKKVIARHSISDSSDYKKALDGKYTQHALRYEIRDMLNYIQPEKVRERQAKTKIDENRKRYEEIIENNRRSIAEICPPLTEWRRQRLGEDDESEFEFASDSEDEEETPTPKIAEKPRQTLQLKRQGITKSFMFQRNKSKEQYELPPVIVKKEIAQDLRIPIS